MLFTLCFFQIKRTWSKKRENVKNPFDHGGCLANFAFTLCSPLPPSLIDRRGYATQESIDAYELSQRQNGTLYGSSGTQVRIELIAATGGVLGLLCLSMSATMA